MKRRSSRMPDRGDGRLAAAAATSLDLLLVSAAVALVAFIIGQLSIIVLPVIAALFIAVVLFPLVAWLRSHGWAPLLATWAVLLATLLLFSGLVALVSAPIQQEFGDVAGAFEEGVDRVLRWTAEGPLSISQAQVERYIDQFVDEVRANGSRIAGGLAAGALRTVEVVAQALLALVLAFFFLKDGRQMTDWFLRRVPEAHRAQVRRILVRAAETLSFYLRGVTFIAMVDAVLVAIVLVLIGVPLVLPLAVLVFIGGFFPFVGALIAGLVASLVALVNNGPLDAVLVAGAILVIQQVEGDVLQPAIMSRAVSLHPVVILLAITGGAGLFGIVGAFLAVPVVAVAVVVGGMVWSAEGDDAEEEGSDPDVPEKADD